MLGTTILGNTHMISKFSSSPLPGGPDEFGVLRVDFCLPKEPRRVDYPFLEILANRKLRFTYMNGEFFVFFM